MCPYHLIRSLYDGSWKIIMPTLHPGECFWALRPTTMLSLCLNGCVFEVDNVWEFAHWFWLASLTLMRWLVAVCESSLTPAWHLLGDDTGIH